MAMGEWDSSTRADEPVLWIVTLKHPNEDILDFCMQRTLDGDLDWLILPIYHPVKESFLR